MPSPKHLTIDLEKDMNTKHPISAFITAKLCCTSNLMPGFRWNHLRVEWRLFDDRFRHRKIEKLNEKEPVSIVAAVTQSWRDEGEPDHEMRVANARHEQAHALPLGVESRPHLFCDSGFRNLRGLRCTGARLRKRSQQLPHSRIGRRTRWKRVRPFSPVIGPRMTSR